MLSEITEILGLQDYPAIAVIITSVCFIFLLYSFIALLSYILKRVGGIK